MSRVGRTFVGAALVLALGLAVGCQATRAPEATQPEATATISATTFDAAKWNSKENGPDEGHRYAAARDLVDRKVLIGKPFEEAAKMLGRPDASAVPALNPGQKARGSYEYDLIEGPLLLMAFDNGVVTNLSISEPAGPVGESVKVAGTWLVDEGGDVKRLEFLPSGGLIRRVEIDGKLRRRFARWQVVEPGKLVIWRPRFSGRPDAAAAYAYRLAGDRMTLTWLDERPATEFTAGRTVEWFPFVAGDLTTVSLERTE